jgi:hypothetical protein
VPGPDAWSPDRAPAAALSQALRAMGAGAAAVAEQSRPDVPPPGDAPVDTAPMLGLDAAMVPLARAGSTHQPHVGLLPVQRGLDQPWVDEETRSAVATRSTPLISVLASGPELDLIGVGRDDDRLRAQARDLRALRHPVLLAPFAGLGEPVGDPRTLLAAWRHTRQVLRAEHADQVQMVWCPAPEVFASDAADRYYPGDDQVDWACTTVVGAGGANFAEAAAPALAWSAAHAVPVLVRLVPPDEDAAAWLRAGMANLGTHPRVRAVVYAGTAPDAEQLSALASWPAGSVSVGRAPGGNSVTSVQLPAAVAAIAAGASAVADLPG